RRYVAIAARTPERESGSWDAPIGRGKDPRHRAVNGPESVAALTHYAIVARVESGAALLALAPVTGRTHQLRVHAAHAGAPLLGDAIYGPGPRGRVVLPGGRVLPWTRVALHAARVRVPDAGGREMEVEAPIPPELDDLWLSLGGDAAAWNTAL